mmetsp:Transcript_45670/g.132973  ORF Transcript_45670/g.132973 Transcript_45670/m.132973 type:complete len:245 (+) Transcript_45670:292-1026(+)
MFLTPRPLFRAPPRDPLRAPPWAPPSVNVPRLGDADGLSWMSEIFELERPWSCRFLLRPGDVDLPFPLAVVPMVPASLFCAPVRRRSVLDEAVVARLSPRDDPVVPRFSPPDFPLPDLPWGSRNMSLPSPVLARGLLPVLALPLLFLGECERPDRMRDPLFRKVDDLSLVLVGLPASPAMASICWRFAFLLFLSAVREAAFCFFNHLFKSGKSRCGPLGLSNAACTASCRASCMDSWRQSTMAS